MSTSGEERRDVGMNRARAANDDKDPLWRKETLEVFRKAALDHEFVYPDLLRRRGAREPIHPNAWGSIWTKAKKQGWIQEAPGKRRKSERPPAHAKKQVVYRSLIMGDDLLD